VPCALCPVLCALCPVLCAVCPVLCAGPMAALPAGVELEALLIPSWDGGLDVRALTVPANCTLEELKRECMLRYTTAHHRAQSTATAHARELEHTYAGSHMCVCVRVCVRSYNRSVLVQAAATSGAVVTIDTQVRSGGQHTSKRTRTHTHTYAHIHTDKDTMH
jgi:hypothetical protein